MLCIFNGTSLDFIPSDVQDGAVGILASPYVDNNRVVYRWEGRWYAVTEPPHMEDVTDDVERDDKATLTFIHLPIRIYQV